MELLTPGLGLFFWTLVVFVVILLILRKFAWGPIMKAIHDREESIENALKAAETARAEMAQLQSGIESAKREAAAERDRILKEANEIKNSILDQAKKDAQSEGAKILEGARESINKEKAAAMAEVKAQVALLSLSIAEKVLAKKFENQAEQEALVNDYLEKISLN
ncbi:MAG: ATP synthase F0 subunit B [Bacteroidetes bacterium]|nr:MAG: ATP synthase F0 subunit B [Bacteroidota bacterium]